MLCVVQVGYGLGKKLFLCLAVLVHSRAARYFACDSHAHLVSKAGAAFNTQSRSSPTSYAISRSISQAIHLRFIVRIALLVGELRLCVLNAAPFENR